MPSMRSLQGNKCGKNSYKSLKYSQSYDAAYHMTLKGSKGLTTPQVFETFALSYILQGSEYLIKNLHPQSSKISCSLWVYFIYTRNKVF